MFKHGLIESEKGLICIAGPCVIESTENLFEIAEHLKKTAEKLSIQFIFKASYDKANRTSLSSFRGIGIKEGLRALREVKEKLNIPILTDIHTPSQVEEVSQIADFLQIPAFLSRQTDLLREASKTKAAVNVKKAQFMAGEDMRFVYEKCFEAAEENRLLFTERGSMFGYHNLVVDMCNIVKMREYCPVIFDATHSIQTPSAADGKSGGNREMIIPLIYSAVAAGADGLFTETHPNPDNAKSDGASMLKLSDIEEVWTKAKKIYSLMKDK